MKNRFGYIKIPYTKMSERKEFFMIKKLLLPAAIMAVIFGVINTQRKKSYIPLLGEKAPSFWAKSTKGMIHFPQDYKDSWVIFFSHPADFTPVCTTEFMTFESMQEEFNELNTKLLGLSVDSVTSHLAWINNIKEKIDYNGMSQIDVDFPIIDDLKGNVAKKYGMIQPDVDETKAVRAVFIIDPESKIRAILYYPQTTGRNLEEIKRVIIALQTTDKFNVSTPCNWEAGDEVIIPVPSTKQEAIERLQNMDNVKCYDWFLCFKKLPIEKIEQELFNESYKICKN